MEPMIKKEIDLISDRIEQTLDIILEHFKESDERLAELEEKIDEIEEKMNDLEENGA